MQRRSEFTVIYLIIPIIGWILNLPPIPILMIGAGILYFILLRDKTFNRDVLVRKFPKKEIGLILTQFILVAAIVLTVTYNLTPQSFFGLLKHNPYMWFGVIIIYPLFSVIPQTIVYRTFFKHRYMNTFQTSKQRIIISGLMFGYAHIILGNWISVALSVAGGMLFAYRYEKTNNFWLSALEHSLYGLLMFNSGVGQYFYSG